MVAWRFLTVLGMTFGIGVSSGLARPAGFYIERLPEGKDVTLPIPATTIVPLSKRILLTSTDMPQSVSFKSINVGSGAKASIRVAIYDSKAKRVHYADIRPDMP